ncbi:hypothetical protein F2Q69_00004593 [Brassica cretica]|uniref:Uncharacterized protein n=1 Tax=Brassica cretica TaxID=69181 RepID=A0A8S9P3Y7_BRACR|nr:hypothetical protein F2Q69_00004593 [Brassica cretica]
MSWGATIDDGHGLFVVGTQQEEHAAEETEAQQPEHVQVNPEVEQIEPQHGRSTRQSTRPSYLEDYVLLADMASYEYKHVPLVLSRFAIIVLSALGYEERSSFCSAPDIMTSKSYVLSFDFLIFLWELSLSQVGPPFTRATSLPFIGRSCLCPPWFVAARAHQIPDLLPYF